MKMDVKHDRDGHIKVNPSWFFQLGLAIMLAAIGYFLDLTLHEIRTELEFSRIERAQLRADLTAFQIGATGDRFSRSDWANESRRLEETLDEIRDRILKLEENQ